MIDYNDCPPPIEFEPRQEPGADVYNLQAEQSLLGALIAKPETLDELPGDMGVEDFSPRHKRIFAAVSSLVFASKPVDIITLAEELSKSGEDELGYLAELATSSLGGKNVSAYAKIITDNTTRRGLVKVGRQISMLAPERMASEDKINAAALLVNALERNNGNDEGADINDCLKRTIDAIDDDFNGKGPEPIKTGLIDFDEKVLIRPADLVVIAGRPSMGKTAAMLTIACNIASSPDQADKRGIIFSIESPEIQITKRMIANLGSLNLGKVSKPKTMTEDDWPKLELGARRLKDTKLTMYEDSSLSLAKARAIVRREHRKEKVDYIMIDYWQLMDVGTQERKAGLAEISRGLKLLAKEIDCTVFLLAQLNRGVEQRPNKRPMLSDIRDCGEIEQDADVVVFLYRDEYYNENSPDKGKAEWITGKQRDGETGITTVAAELQYCRFSNFAHSYRDL